MLKNLDYFLPGFESYVSIVANGQFPENPLILAYLSHSKLIIACDGALKKLADKSLVADYVIGDGDSADLSAEAKNPYIYVANQNSNDLTKAVEFASQQLGPTNPLVIFAASGLREDHALANIALLLKYAATWPLLAMLSDYGIFRVCPAGKSAFPTLRGQQISFFSCDPQNRVSCQNLKWPLQQTTFKFLNSGSLNQATTNHLEIFCDKPLLIFQAFEVKPS